MIGYSLKLITHDVEHWFNKDPVRPELSNDFRTRLGREVYGLLDEDGEFKSFLCLAYTTDIPRNIDELDELTAYNGRVIIPYTVWSYKRGAGKTIINLLIAMARDNGMADRVVTLSPQTEMAKKFHLKNGAIELQRNYDTVNFEYPLKEGEW
jgi:hypothetical protein